jgi:lambda family phage tail tape measure protein
MAEPIGSLRAELSAGHAQFSSDMRKARNAVETNAKGMNTAMGKVKTSFDGNVNSLISFRNKALAAGAALAGIALAAKSFGSAAMRYETLGAVMEAVGKNAGYTGAQMEEFQKRLEKTGISMIQSRNAVIKMTQANLDLEKSTELARVAQDAAVIGNVNSSEAFNRLIHGIQSAQTEVLRMIGINVNFEDSYKRIAKQTGRTTTQLSEAEKAQIRMNAVLDAGSGIAGTYEASMGTAGKQLGSLARHLENLKVMAGKAITPALAEIVDALTSSIAALNDELDGDGKDAIEKWGINFRLAIISIRAEILRLGMLLDKVGGTMTSAQMLLYGPGSALGFKSSQDRFKRAADRNIMYEQLYSDKDRQLLELAKKYNEIEALNTPAGRAAAKMREEVRAKQPRTEGAVEDEKAAKEAENRLKRGQDLILSLERERDLIRAVTREEKVRWDLSKGPDNDLAEPHKQRILAIAKELDALDAAVKAEEERKAVLKSIDEEIAALQKETDTYGMSETAIRLYEMSLKDATEGQKESVEVLMRDLEIKKQVAQVMEDIKTPLDEYAEKMRVLNDLLAMGEINQGQYAEAAEKARKAMEAAAKDEKDILDDLKKAIEGWGQDSADALVEFGLTGKKTFSDFADSVIKDILRMIVYQTMMQPLMSGISGAVSGFFSGAGAGGGAARSVPVAVAKGGVFEGGSLTPFARGGIVNRPTIFPMASGMGLMGEAGPEAVMPLTRLPGGDLGVKSGGGNNIKINIINNNGSDVSTQQSETSQGLQLDVMIDQAVAKKLGQSGTASNRAMKNTFGAKESLVTR